MKRLTACLSILAFAAAASYRAETKPAPGTEVYIIQDDTRQNVSSGTVAINKKEFTMVFVIHGTPEFKINFSGDSHIHDAALAKIDQSYLFPFFTGCSGAESDFNKNKDIFIHNDANQFWYYTDSTDHRFDSVLTENGTYTCTRTVKYYYDRDLKQDIDISRYAGNTLYVTMIRYTNRTTKKMINFNTILVNSPFSEFARWALENRYVDRSIFSDTFDIELERICFKIIFIV